jgi:hypothetical protein
VLKQKVASSLSLVVAKSRITSEKRSDNQSGGKHDEMSTRLGQRVTGAKDSVTSVSGVSYGFLEIGSLYFTHNESEFLQSTL